LRIVRIANVCCVSASKCCEGVPKFLPRAILFAFYRASLSGSDPWMVTIC